MTGPTFEEMLHPGAASPAVRRAAQAARSADPLDPINLYNISWRGGDGQICFEVLPEALTGVRAPIVVLYSTEFPTRSHKVGAAYSTLMEHQLLQGARPYQHTLVWPSTGNFGIGGAWVGGRMRYDSIVVLPRTMSQERFDLLIHYGARIVKTPGVESTVKETYQAIQELRRADPEHIRVLDQFAEMGNYRFHYYVTGNTVVELAAVLQERGIGKGKISAFCSAMGSAGTIAAGDRLKQVWPDHRVVGLEPVQCSTLYDNGYGTHNIQGVGDNQVTWVHHVGNMDAIVCVDDQDCLQGLQVLVEEAGWKTLISRYGVPEARVRKLSGIFGISGVCNVLGAIKTARFYQLGADDVVVTVCTDAIDRYRSVMTEMARAGGPLAEIEAAVRLERIFHGQRTDWIQEGTVEARHRWHNLKYYTWVDLQGKTTAELDAQRDPEWWLAQQARVAEIDARLRAEREGL